jgi:hypothetical protein
MAEHEVRSRAVYDHDKEEPRPAGRRRRQVADWGVGEEIFDHMPGRRFERRSHQEIPRGDAADGRRTIVIETAEEHLPSTRPVPAPVEDEFASREEAIRAREVHDELWAGDEPFADPRVEAPADEDAEFVSASGGQHDTGEFAAIAGSTAAAPDERLDHDASLDGDDSVVPGGVAGRRTVKIGGRPAEFHGPPARARQRPPRTLHERLGPRPDRLAMWAFALGILLILIAVITGNA